jgi:choline dehydrogenase-like flavoprotein
MQTCHDALVVGAGPIGITVARRLAEGGLRVKVFEAGSDQFRFSFSDKDRERMWAMEAEVRRLAAELGPWRRGCELTWLPHGAAHLVGTCAMDADDRRGVTDPQGRVHGFDNLYLATLGRIPAPVAVNPTLTAVALALGNCDAILS